MTLIKIKRLERNISWGTRDPLTGKFNEKYSDCFDKWVPGLSKINGQLNVGFDSDEVQEKFEKQLYLEPGGLGKNSPFWDNYSIIIPDKGLTLNDADWVDKLKLHVLSIDPTVATTVEEGRLNAKAEYVMTSLNDEAKVGNKKRDSIANAFVAFSKLSQSEIIEALYMFGKDPDVTDSEVCRDMLGDILEKDPNKFLAVVGDKLFKDKVWMIKLIKAGVIMKSGVGVGYDMPLYFGDIVLGKGLEEAIAYIKDSENQNIFVGLKKAHEAMLKKKK
jgi:hypothetical protein